MYGVTAASRGPILIGLLHQTPGEVGATLRYHYTPQALLVVVVCVGLSVLNARWPRSGQAALVCALVVGLVAGLVRHPVRLDLHENTRRQVTTALDRLRTRVALSAGPTVYLDNRRLAGLGWMPGTMVGVPGLAALFVIAFPSDEIDGHRVRFREGDRETYRTFTARPGRLADILVPAFPTAHDARTGGPSR